VKIKYKIISIVLTAIIIFSSISGCGIANTSTDDAGELQSRDDEKESPLEVNDWAKQGGATYDFRPEYKDGSGPQTENAEVSNYGNIGSICYIEAGERVQYTVDAEKSGKYNFAAWISSGHESPGNLIVFYNDSLIGATESSVNEDWSTYYIYNVGDVDLAAGTGVIKVEFPDGNINFAALEVSYIG